MSYEDNELTEADYARLLKMRARLDVDFESEMETEENQQVDPGLSDCPHRVNGRIDRHCDLISYIHVVNQMIDNTMRVASQAHMEHPVLFERIVGTCQTLTNEMLEQLTELRCEIQGSIH